MREGRYFRTTESKKHTLADLVERYIENVLPAKPRNAGIRLKNPSFKKLSLEALF
ncbi:MAG: hypothetical protein JJU12_01530 [Chlamydiales bacterium]|nr:hypothetical protein [Chlamydiales bacterium]